jgi:isoaspartyl peptidase/L-asparaginase-like protein (Ntn-hydrolase superfamily)
LERILSGGSALDAVEAAVTRLEDDPRFNAGTGSVLRRDGLIEMDAAVMESSKGYGAVACIQNVKNPVQVARRVMQSPYHILVGEGALRFAREEGFPPYNPETPEARRRHSDRGHLPEPGKPLVMDTVGAVARDFRGNLAAATSTGGISYAPPGRVGDTPLIGCGIFVSPSCAICLTGRGEEILRILAARTIHDLVVGGLDPRQALQVVLGPLSPPSGALLITQRDSCHLSTGPMATASVTGNQLP